MKFKTTKNKIIKIASQQQEYPLKSEYACRSKIQYECGQKIKKKFPQDPILEDVPVDGASFYFDFWLPRRKMVFEIQGKQHNEYVPFFHGSRGGFIKANDRDLAKKEFCRINSIKLYNIYSIEEMDQVLSEL